MVPLRVSALCLSPCPGMPLTAQRSTRTLLWGGDTCEMHGFGVIFRKKKFIDILLGVGEFRLPLDVYLCRLAFLMAQFRWSRKSSGCQRPCSSRFILERTNVRETLCAA